MSGEEKMVCLRQGGLHGCISLNNIVIGKMKELADGHPEKWDRGIDLLKEAEAALDKEGVKYLSPKLEARRECYRKMKDAAKATNEGKVQIPG